MARRKKTYEDDDGRVIASMNVDGMPWHIRDGLEKQQKRQSMPSSSDFSDLTKEEEREIIKGAMKAGLLISGVFIAGAFLFILFCLLVWFR